MGPAFAGTTEERESKIRSPLRVTVRVTICNSGTVSKARVRATRQENVSKRGHAMTNRDQSPDLQRRTFLGGATAAGVASVLAPPTALAQASAPPAPAASGAGITALTAENLVGSGVNYAYA